MKSVTDVSVVLVTAPDVEVARKLAHALLTARLAACVNVIPAIESYYWWKGKLESGAESLLLIKTVNRHLPEVERCVLENHPYETPEIVSLPLSGGNERYLLWLVEAARA